MLRGYAGLRNTDFRTDVPGDGLDGFLNGPIEGVDWLAVDIDDAETFAFGLAEFDDLLCEGPDDE